MSPWARRCALAGIATALLVSGGSDGFGQSESLEADRNSGYERSTAGRTRRLGGRVGNVAGSVRTVESRVHRRTRDEPVLTRVVHFCFDRDSLRDDADDTLKDFARTIRQTGRPLRVEVDGYTDSVGSPNYNDDLSNRRASRVASRLRSLLRLSWMPDHRGHGEHPRAARNRQADGSDNPTGRARNRRARIRVRVSRHA
jgi:outer membrane protein OmpA-like peptidoglycan-associated protein